MAPVVALDWSYFQENQLMTASLDKTAKLWGK
jgi:hypothetical protein